MRLESESDVPLDDFRDASERSEGQLDGRISIGPGDYDPGQFVFVPAHSFFEPRIRTVVVPAARTNIIINRTKIVNHCITIENNVVRTLTRFAR